MAVRVGYDSSLEQKVAFGYSVACEACWALNCLTHPEQHSLQSSWIVEMREQMPQGLHTRIVQIEPNDWDAAVSLFQPASFAPLEFEIAQVRALDAEEIRAALSTRRSSRADESLEDTVAWRDYLCDLLDAFWPYFEPTWAKLSQRFTEEIIGLERLRQEGAKLPRLLPELAAQITWNSTKNEIVLATFTEARLDAKKLDALVVQPSYFCAPQVRVRFGPSLAVWAPFASALALDEPPAVDVLVKPLKALAQDTRLKMMALLMRSPRSTRELAGILRTSPPAISRHLRRLSEAGLVHQAGRSKRGMYVQYEVDAQAIDELEQELALFLERADA